MARGTKSSELQLGISHQIIDLCRREEWPRGHRLTERDLAAEFGVSRSPVRAALDLLVSEGVIGRSEGGGYFLEVGGAELQDVALSVPQAAGESLYLKILRDLFMGNLEGQVSEADLFRRYQVSRGLLLKVLMRLSEEGFVHRGQGHGWTFRETLNTIADYKASYEFRLAIEPAGIRSSDFKVDHDRLKRLKAKHLLLLKDGLDKTTGIKQFELDAELHETIASFSGNKFFLEAVQYHNRLRRIVEYESFAADERMKDSCEEHLMILDALERGDRDWAATLLTRHLKLASESVAVF